MILVFESVNQFQGNSLYYLNGLHATARCGLILDDSITLSVQKFICFRQIRVGVGESRESFTPQSGSASYSEHSQGIYEC